MYQEDALDRKDVLEGLVVNSVVKGRPVHTTRVQQSAYAIEIFFSPCNTSRVHQDLIRK